MTDHELRDFYNALTQMLRPHLDRSEPLRRLAAHFGQWLIEASAPSRDGALQDVQPARAGAPTPIAAPDNAPAARTIEQAYPLPPAIRGPQEVAAAATRQYIDSVRRGAFETIVDESQLRERQAREWDLALIVQRCRLKARSCRLYIQRRAAVGDPLKEPLLINEMNDLISEAKSLPDCFLWVFWRERTQPNDEILSVIARCYDAHADAVALLQFLDSASARVMGDEYQEAFDVLTEANSALRVALNETWLTSPDMDQEEMHFWLREQTVQRQIYVARHMRLNDPADPDDAPSIISQIEALCERVQRRVDRHRQIEILFKKLYYHVEQARRNGEEYAFHRMAETIQTLDDVGVPSSDRRYRAIDSALITHFPQDVTGDRAVGEVLRHLSNWQQSGASDDAAPEASEFQWSDQVRRVREMLAGHSVVVIGGERRIEQAQRMQDAFDLLEVKWVRLSEHGSAEPMRAPIAQSDTRLVIVLLKLAGHHHAEEAVAQARAAGKPVITLRAGYSPEQIADAVVQQASRQLSPVAAD